MRKRFGCLAAAVLFPAVGFLPTSSATVASLSADWVKHQAIHCCLAAANEDRPWEVTGKIGPLIDPTGAGDYADFRLAPEQRRDSRQWSQKMGSDPVQ